MKFPHSLHRRNATPRPTPAPSPQQSTHLNSAGAKKKGRRHITWALNQRPRVYPVDVPKPWEKADHWFESTEVFVVLPRLLLVPAGRQMEFRVSSRIRFLSLHALPPSRQSSDRNADNGDADPTPQRATVLEISTAREATEDASKQLEALYGIHSKAPRPTTAAHVATPKKPSWITIARVTPGCSTSVGYSLIAGVHVLRAQGVHDVLIAAVASGLQTKLQ